jgi:hypothetical protein
MGIFTTTILVILFILPINVNHASFNKNISSGSQSPLATKPWNHPQYQLCISQPSGNGHSLALIYVGLVSEILFPSLAETGHPTQQTTNRNKSFLGLVPTEHSYHPFSSSDKTQRPTFYFGSVLNLSFKIFPLQQIFSFYMVLLT